MLNPIARIKRTFGLKPDTRFVSKLITTQYDDLMFSENGNVVHPEMEEILQLFAAMEQFAEEGAQKLGENSIPLLSADAQKEMSEVLDRVSKMTDMSKGNEAQPGLLGRLLTRISDRSKGSTAERFQSIFQAAVESTVALGKQVEAERDYLESYRDLNEAMSEGTVLTTQVRKRQSERRAAAMANLQSATERMAATDVESDDYALVRHEATVAQRAYDMEQKRYLFASDLYANMTKAHHLSEALATSLAQKTYTKEGLWVTMSTSLNTNQTTFSMAQANLGSMEGMSENAKMKAIMDGGNKKVVLAIASMSSELQKRATQIAYSGGAGADELKALGSSVLKTRLELEPMIEKMVDSNTQEAQRMQQLSMDFRQQLVNASVDNATKSLSHQKAKRDGLALGHDTQNIIDVQATEVLEGVPVQGNEPAPPRMRHAAP